MSAVVLDTHAIIWYFLDSPKLSEFAKESIDSATQIYLASISLVEMIYLNEKTRIPDVALERLNQALCDPYTAWMVIVLDTSIAQSIQQIPRNIVPEMPDRIIAATAIYLDFPLVTRDLNIKQLNIQTIW